jgi:hypothetical protein
MVDEQPRDEGGKRGSGVARMSGNDVNPSRSAAGDRRWALPGPYLSGEGGIPAAIYMP